MTELSMIVGGLMTLCAVAIVAIVGGAAVEVISMVIADRRNAD